MKVLIADDNRSVRKMIRSIIQPVAEDIYECADGDDAVEIYIRIRPDWVLMDFEMLQVDGLTATRKIISRFPNARIILVTQYDDEDLRLAAEEAGVESVVLKDDLLDLRSKLRRKQQDFH